MTRVRIRQHVNPLSYKYHQPLIIPDWEQIYDKLDQPLHLDIGSARGKFLLQMAPLYPNINFLGVEIREPLVIEANNQRDDLGVSNLHFLFCNINLSITSLFGSLPPGILKWVTIQFPDPWFKQSHKKRRVVQPILVNAIAQYLSDDGLIFLQSDVKEIALQMGNHFLANTCFEKHKPPSQFELIDNPFLIQTEREIATLNKSQPIYRLLLQKKVVQCNTSQ
ncbi:tRNA (guanosine(46)-N7)-methyltransferase TrmB [Aphanothece sacrum]|uniref:tRNA (guanine-N(7)-)-methyltransferase n=1 Tax=Aphanothece sacrum FPU1 TaxID=1920663 RepID=A0A401IMV0_APHSA|nr:tRNA (guanosine(46)-N7)-methyltransferase TrmB [Aphanothece sacrum]GBF82566.1 tRNA (guanine-N(7)-)-methyltransferase [Aphanothece sacrum FPU1]GBF84700.1 tRNA (guanine-N(7)-)-methyltransferase [Aphanothece sacrum FPU3]